MVKSHTSQAKKNKTTVLNIMKFNYNRAPSEIAILVTNVLVYWGVVYWGVWHPYFVNNT